MDDPTLPPPDPEAQELQDRARRVADDVLVIVVDRLPDPAAAIDVLCYCTAYLAWRAGLSQTQVTERLREYMAEAEERARAGAIALEARRKGRR